jgi:outer membrane protein assembly factor BamB
MRQQPNQITDDEAWFKTNGLALPVLDRSRLPPHVPDRFAGRMLQSAFDHGDHLVMIYGADTVAVVRNDGAIVGLFDVGKVAHGISSTPITWGQARDGVLYLKSANMGYARVSRGYNAYLTAIDMADGSLRWRSDPLVANSRNFVIHGGHIISGYGFTAEPDNLFVIDRANGSVVHKISLSTKPDAILEKNGKLYVRGYNADFSFDIDPAAGPKAGPVEGDGKQPSGSLVPEGVALEPTDSDRTCRDAAIAHIDRGRFADAAAALWQLSRHYKNSAAIVALRDLVNDAQAGKRIDLQRDPIVLARPPFAAVDHSTAAAGHPPLAPSTPPRLVQRKATPNGITDTAAWMQLHGKAYPGRRAPNPFSRDAGELGPEIPLRYGLSAISGAMMHADHVALIYGGRFVALAAGGRATAVFDFQSFITPPAVKSDGDARFATQEVTWAEARDGVLYVCNGGGSYASEVFGKKGFVSAVDVSRGTLLWRSAPLTCNANFILHGAYLITGYGFTAEPDHLFVLDRQSGKPVSRTPIASGPDKLVSYDGKLFVRTYDTDYEFDLL